ncbi:hypothetical protein BDW59DRAFT_164207 [Aspergillus cavernicola]|uniref:Zn(2)-C6 fungal-type domain-containing protein n=1 Tax=Aspergillus cavernicola TaxID=176166 RepID=A0ABR4I1Y3_9EURO
MTCNKVTKQAARNKQACRLCRSRKVRRDSVHPRCGLCRTENVQRTYEQDRRQTSRVSQAVIQRLADKLAEVEETVHRLEHSLPQQQFGQIQTPTATATPVISPNHAAFQAIDDELLPLITNNGKNIFGEDPPSNPSLDKGQTTPVEIHTGVEDGGHISVYGSSSTFNPPLSNVVDRQRRPAGRASSFAQAEEDTLEEQCRLFADSALQIQKEWTYMTERKFDLDGLDFDTA